ncbi:MAG: glycosyltransferase family 4 protein [Gemmatimonadota bacterium]
MLVPGAFALSWMLTRVVRDYALRSGQLDHPNARSSHVAPTPRGGGVAFVITTLIATTVLAVSGVISRNEAIAVLGGGALVATVGMIDDRRGLPARTRLGAHLCATLGLVLLLDLWQTPALASLAPVIRLGVLTCAVVGGAWLINLTNFMDGIDGIAAVETVTACVGIAICTFLATARLDAMLLPLLVAAGAAGFLIWNWPPARIFMGDAGSGFLGFMFAAMTIGAVSRPVPALLWCTLILLGVFVVDATVTLVHRAVRGERLTEGHRTHGYQQLSRRFGSHRAVTSLVALINVGWLLPCALLVATGYLHGVLATAMAYVPLVACALWAGSGAPERPRIPGRA